MAANVYETIRAQLLNNAIEPAQRLNIDALAKDLSVSTTLIREALLRLEGDDLVVREPYKGYRATDLLTRAELEELFELRLLIEPWAARKAASRELGNPNTQLLAEARALAREAGASGIDRRLLMESDMSFHGTIIAAAGNRRIQRVYQHTHCHLHLFRLCTPHLDGRHTAAEHLDIAKALAAADPEHAATAMRQHLTAAYDRFAT